MTELYAIEPFLSPRIDSFPNPLLDIMADDIYRSKFEAKKAGRTRLFVWLEFQEQVAHEFDTTSDASKLKTQVQRPKSFAWIQKRNDDVMFVLSYLSLEIKFRPTSQRNDYQPRSTWLASNQERADFSLNTDTQLNCLLGYDGL